VGGGAYLIGKTKILGPQTISAGGEGSQSVDAGYPKRQ